jgi:uncharacterized protein YeaC (DUF1315 family)
MAASTAANSKTAKKMGRARWFILTEKNWKERLKTVSLWETKLNAEVEMRKTKVRGQMTEKIRL